MAKLTDAQLRRIRDDFHYFVQVVLHRSLDERQLEVFTDPHRIIVFVAGRGVGKTTVAAMYAAWRCIREAKHVVVWGSSAEEQAGLGGDILRDFVDGGPLEAYIVERSADRVKFENGSVIHFIPNSARRARGFHNRWVADYVVNEASLLKRVAKARRRAPSITLLIDESKDVSAEVYTAAMGVLTASSESRAMFMGSAGGKDSWFYREFVSGIEGDGETKSFVISAEDCEWIDQAVLREIKGKLDNETYRAEYCGEFMDALSSYFTPEMIADATMDYEIPSDFDEDYEYVVSCDLAPSERFGSDFAVVMVLGRHFGRTYSNIHTSDGWRRETLDEPIPPHIRLFRLARYQHLDHDGLRRELETVKRKFPTLSRGITESYESQQMDALVRRIVRRGIDVAQRRQYNARGHLDITMEIIDPSNAFQHEAFSGLHHLIREGELWLPMEGEHVKTLRQELIALQKEITPAGNVRWQAAKGYHDDTVYSLLWAATSSDASVAVVRGALWDRITNKRTRERAVWR